MTQTPDMVEILSRAMHHKLYSDDARECHMAASPLSVEAAIKHSRADAEVTIRRLESHGYVIVPKEPTEEMKDAAMKAVFDGTRADIRDETIYETSAFGSAYRAMIRAAKG